MKGRRKAGGRKEEGREKGRKKRMNSYPKGSINGESKTEGELGKKSVS